LSDKSIRGVTTGAGLQIDPGRKESYHKKYSGRQSVFRHVGLCFQDRSGPLHGLNWLLLTEEHLTGNMADLCFLHEPLQ